MVLSSLKELSVSAPNKMLYIYVAVQLTPLVSVKLRTTHVELC